MKAAETRSTATPQRLQAKGERPRSPFFAKESASGVLDSGHTTFFALNRAEGIPRKAVPAKRTVRCKLRIGQPGDKYEQEADSMADQVVQRLGQNRNDRGPSGTAARLAVQREPIFESETEPEVLPPAIQKKCAKCQQEELREKADPGAEAVLQRKPVSVSAGRSQPGVEVLSPKCAKCADEEVQREQRKEAQEGTVPGPDHFTSQIDSSKGGGSPLSKETRAQMEPAFGADFSKVRIHTGGDAEQLSQSLQAHAFTRGNDIYFNTGKYDTSSREGQRLLAHELTHTIQQTGNRPPMSDGQAGTASGGVGIRDATISRATGEPAQRFPSASEIVESLEETVSDAADAVHGAVNTVGGAVSDAVNSVGDSLAGAGEAIGSAAGAVADSAVSAGGAILEAGEEAIDWLATQAGQLAIALADALGASVSVTANGLEIVVPRLCPIDAITEHFDLEPLSGDYMVPLVAIPIGTVALTGEVGVTGHVEPRVDVQLGPICLDGVRLVINPVTGSLSISGSVSATAAASLAAELRGGLRGAVSLKGFILIGGIPVPIDVPIAGLEGGLAGLVRGLGAGTLTIGGALSAGAGAISMRQTRQLDLGLAGDLFVGAYGQIDIRGKNVCRIYWQPLEWHGDIAGSLGVTIGLTVTPGGAPVVVPTISPPVFSDIPFSQIPLVLSRRGFSDDCPIKDAICQVLEALGWLPSQNGGVWKRGGPYGPGPRLPGPLEVYQKKPGIPSGAECRGACGPDCRTCEPTAHHRFVDPATGDTWDYLNFQDCNTNEGCRQHDAAFDWAAAVHGETGPGAIIMPWHMAANIECTCKNPAGNCLAWIAGLPPYDGKLFFADAATLVARGGGRGGPAGDSCHTDFPNAPDCRASFPDRDAVLAAWGVLHGISGFTHCVVVADLTAASAVACRGGPGKYWNCDARDTVTGQNVTVGLFECICCNDDDTTGSMWMEPHIVVDPTVMSDELILELCDRGLIPRVICLPFEARMIRQFGRGGRDLGIDPDREAGSRLRPDDAPILESFKRAYNRFDSWSVFIRVNHPELLEEFKSEFDVETRRDRWLTDVNVAGKAFKDSFRDIGNAKPERSRQDYLAVVTKVENEITALNRQIAVWFQGRTGAPGTIEEIIEGVHAQGTELWRAAWRRAILQVNRVLARLWPPAKQRVLTFVSQKRAAHPDTDLYGTVGELDYLGSLSSGFKGPPKQNIRFNPRNFDVDAFINARPLSQYAVLVRGKKPKHGNIFASNTDIEPLKTFSAAAQTELVARVEGYKNDPSDPFDVAIKTEDLPEQARGKAATERLYGLRMRLPPNQYDHMIDELRAAGLLTADGSAIRDELSESEADAAKAIMDRHEPPQSLFPTPAPRAP